MWQEIERSFLTHADLAAMLMPDGESITYAELFSLVCARAGRLRRRIPSGSKVAVIDRRPQEEAIHLLALTALGTVIVPAPVKYGETRCRQIVSHTRPDFLLTSETACVTSGLADACQAAGTQIVSMDNDFADRSFESANIACSELDRSNRFVMYTSGSTGLPKGSVLTERNVLANIRDIRTYFTVMPGDNLLITRAFCHAATLTGDFLYGLLSGARIVFDTEPFMARRLLAFMERHRISVYSSTPTIFYQLALDKSAIRPSSLRLAQIGGEYLHRQVAQTIAERFSDMDIYCIYGLTEASPRVSYVSLQQYVEKTGCIGLLLPSMEAFIADHSGEPLAAGEIGELVVKGPNVFLGYWEDEALTHRKLRNGWLYTGDMAYKGPEGCYYTAGRKDDMIIRAGMNIYPKEIEHPLVEDFRIREAYAFGVPNPRYGQQIHVRVVSQEGQSLTKADVMDICRSKLGSYQYPDVIEIVAEIPRSATGKSLRNANDSQSRNLTQTVFNGEEV